MLIRVKATPNASKGEIIGWSEDPLAGKVLCLKIAEPPVDGKANKAILQYLAKELKLPKSQISLCKGQKSRIKCFEVPDGTSLPGW